MWFFNHYSECRETGRCSSVAVLFFPENYATCTDKALGERFSGA